MGRERGATWPHEADDAPPAAEQPAPLALNSDGEGAEAAAQEPSAEGQANSQPEAVERAAEGEDDAPLSQAAQLFLLHEAFG